MLISEYGGFEKKINILLQFKCDLSIDATYLDDLKANDAKLFILLRILIVLFTYTTC